jgi:hypothetical protein
MFLLSSLSLFNFGILHTLAVTIGNQDSNLAKASVKHGKDDSFETARNPRPGKRNKRRRVLFAETGEETAKNAPGVLHDSYAGNWIPMSPEEALNYYTPYEVCKLYQLEERGSSIQCSDFSASHAHLPDACLLEREGFASTTADCGRNAGAQLRHKSTLPWPEGYNFRSVVHRMRKHGMNTLFMIGDSITSQHLSDAYCAAHRLGFEDISFIDPQQFIPETVRTTSFMIPTYQGVGTKEKPYFQAIHLLFERVVVIDKATSFKADPLTVFPFSNDRKMIDMILGNPTEGVNTSHTMFGTSTGKAVFIINAGLHDHGSDNYETSINVLLRFALFYAEQGHHVFFRETSTQHFKTETGEFPWGDPTFSWSFPEKLKEEIHKNMSLIKAHASIVNELTKAMYGNSIATTTEVDASSASRRNSPNIEELQNRIHLNKEMFHQALTATYSCVHPTSLMDQNWKNKLAKLRMNEFDPSGQHIKILPFWEITAGRFDAHSRVKKDCSHFCNNPMLFLPLWDSLAKYLAMEKK